MITILLLISIILFIVILVKTASIDKERSQAIWLIEKECEMRKQEVRQSFIRLRKDRREQYNAILNLFATKNQWPTKKS